MPETLEDRGLNLLAIDGGGARGLSALVILEELMQRIQHRLDLSTFPDPCDHFDLMAGTGTGGVHAIFMGRLGMSIDQAKKCYSKLATDVFSDKKLLSLGGPVFKAAKLEQSLQAIVKEIEGDPHARMVTPSVSMSNKCKAFVCAMSRYNMNAGIPCLMRTYDAPANQMPNYTIYEALRATMAHPELFKPVELGEGHFRESFVDGGLGCNNPIEQLIAEAKFMFPGRHISSIISIGAGHTRTIQIPKPSLFRSMLPLDALIATKNIATDCERAAQEMARRFQNVSDLYFRFNVDQGLQGVGQGEWERLGEVIAHARAYLKLAETDRNLSVAAQAICDRQRVAPVELLDGQLQAPAPQPVAVKSCPPPSPVFTGREKEIQQISTCLLGEPMQRHVFVLHGLGGVGKTQTALRFLELTQDKFSDIVYVDATSHDTIASSFRGFASDKHLGNTHTDAIQWLSNTAACWLLVFNNADDPQIDLRDYFPAGSHGNILITTRCRDLALLAQGIESACQLLGLPDQDGVQLLLKTSRLQIPDLTQEEEDAASDLVRDVGYLALAIIQIGAYIWRTGCSLVDYHESFSRRRQDLLEEYKKMPVKVDDYQKTVYTTWLMSYERLGDQATKILHLISFIHREHVLGDIFQRAAKNLSEYTPVIPFDEREAAVQSWVKEFLDSFNDAEGSWDGLKFTFTMSELLSFSLIDYDRLSQTYSVHPLVHDWARAITPNQSATLERMARLVTFSVGVGRSRVDLAFRISLVPHINEIARQQDPLHVNNASRYIIAYDEAGLTNVVEEMQEWMLVKVREALGDDNIGTLASMANVAVSYCKQGRWAEAEPMFLQTIEGMRRVVGEDDPGTLIVMSNFATEYLAQGRLEDAETLETQVYSAYHSRGVTPENVVVGILNLGNLAKIYRKQGRWEAAEEVQLKILEMHKHAFGKDHPDTISCMIELALTYSEQYRWDEAEELQECALGLLRETVGPVHPTALDCMHAMAVTYSHQGRLKEAEETLNMVLLLGDLAPGTRDLEVLSTLDALAKNYGEQGRWEDALPLLLLVHEKRLLIQGDGHPQTLTTMNNLSAAYAFLDRPQEALPLQSHVLLHRTRIFGENHPDVLTATNTLSGLYIKLKEFDKAEELQMKVVDGRKRALGDDHPRTLTSMSNMVHIYLGQLRPEEAIQQVLEVLVIMRQKYGVFHADTITTMSELVTIYSDQGMLAEAEAVQTELVEVLIEQVGEARTITLAFMSQLAKIYKEQGRGAECEALTNRIAALEGAVPSD